MYTGLRPASAPQVAPSWSDACVHETFLQQVRGLPFLDYSHMIEVSNIFELY